MADIYERRTDQLIATIGINTQKVYVTGVHPEEVMRKLHKKYPSFDEKKGKGERATMKTSILPEPMRLIGVIAE